MATTPLTPPAYLDALRAALVTRAGLSGVSIYTGHVGDDGGLESVQFQQVEDAVIDWNALGNRSMQESFTVIGFVWIAKPGAGETVIKAARDRAFALLNEVLDATRSDPAVNASVQLSRLASYDVDQGVGGDGLRACRITFRLNVQSRITAI